MTPSASTRPKSQGFLRPHHADQQRTWEQRFFDVGDAGVKLMRANPVVPVKKHEFLVPVAERLHRAGEVEP